MTNLISKHGGYKNLQSFQMAEIVFDLTSEFCSLHIDKSYKPNMSYNPNRQADQMLQAARSGKQNIAEGSQTSGTSKQSELRLMDVARASLEELKNDYEDFLRAHKLCVWSQNDHRALVIRQLAYSTNRSYKTYMTHMSEPESAANCLLCLINQTNFLLDRQLRALEKDLREKGDFKERLKNYQKQLITGGSDDYDEFLKQQGLRRLENGQVVKDE